jgi:hypothetical protein
MILPVPLSGDESVVVLHVRDGEIADAGSWVYTWVRVDGDRRVVYVGATGLQPETRTWLHLHDPDPDIGRIATRYPAALDEPLDVLAVQLPEGVSRQEAKIALTARLAEAGFLSERYVGDSPVDTAAVAPDTAPHVEHLVTLVGRHVAG